MTYGLMLGSFGVGAVGGAVAGARLRSGMSNEALMRSGALCSALAATVVAISPFLGVAMAALLFAGAAWVLVLSAFNVTVQMSAPRWVAGRALAIYQMGTFLGLASGSWLWGGIAASHGVPAALLGSGAALAAVPLMGLRWPLPDIGLDDLDIVDGWRAPGTPLDLKAHSGPIVIMIDYYIQPDRAERFISTMARRRLVRLRNGARQWHLLHDLADPTLWTERFEHASWIEYQRHMHRTTRADLEVTRELHALHALHAGSGPPLVRRTLKQNVASRSGRESPLSVQLADFAHQS